MSLTGAANILELYGLAEACDVDIRLELNEAEVSASEKVSNAIQQAMDHENAGPAGPGARAA